MYINDCLHIEHGLLCPLQPEWLVQVMSYLEKAGGHKHQCCPRHRLHRDPIIHMHVATNHKQQYLPFLWPTSDTGIYILNNCILSMMNANTIAMEATVCVFMAGWLMCTMKNFHSYWLRHSDEWHAARALLSSEVCTDAMLRIAVGHFDKCAEAKATLAMSPMHRAVFSVAEDLHVCGNRRCELFYIDVTERLTSVLFLVALVLIMVVWRGFKRKSEHAHDMQEYYWKLPCSTIEYKKD